MAIHMAKHVDTKGRISPLCADPPKALRGKGINWTVTRRFVTCPNCKQLIPPDEAVNELKKLEE